MTISAGRGMSQPVCEDQESTPTSLVQGSALKGAKQEDCWIRSVEIRQDQNHQGLTPVTSFGWRCDERRFGVLEKLLQVHKSIETGKG